MKAAKVARRLRSYLKLHLITPYISFLAGSMILLDLLGRISIVQSPVLLSIDLACILLFAIDYLLGLIEADSKREFFKKNIIELLSIIPIYQFRVLRALRLIRLLRLVSLLLRARGAVLSYYSIHRFAYVISIMALVIAAGSLAMYVAERDHSITSFQDAVWWSVVTITTVGYGDISPATDVGKLIAVILMIAGVGVLGAFTGTVASLILAKRKNVVSIDEEGLLSGLNSDELRQVHDFIQFLKYKKTKPDA